MNNRTHMNPIVGDKVTFLETAAETGGKHTLVEVELLANAKGTPLHYHTVTTEIFTVLEGELGLQSGKQELQLKRGETAIIPLYTRHRFFNSSGKPVKFTVKLSPGSMNFENSLKIAYALARDGKCNSQSIPKNISHLALLFDMGEGRMPGMLSVIMPLLKKIAARARKKGIEKELIEQYC